MTTFLRQSLTSGWRERRRTLILGILNVTPDSFSDGGAYAGVDAAVQRARQMVAEGADAIDIGGESTRPGHQPVSADEELSRVVPVLERLCAELPVPISIDTTKAVVARRALELGATILNDQWGLQGDPDLARIAADHGAEVIAMHNRSAPTFGDVVADVTVFLERSLEIADAAGIGRERVIVDPGFGFGKTPEQNLEMLRRLPELRTLDRPVLVGTSRKSMIGRVLGATDPADRLEGTATTVALAIAAGARIVRVHDVRSMSRVARMTDAIIHGIHAESATR